MVSSNGHTPLLPSEEEPPHSVPIFRPMERRTPSFSSASPSGSWDSSFRSSSPLKFKGIPFSWEQIPGIAKHQGLKKKDSTGYLLPLPPAGTTTSSAIKKQEEISPKKGNKGFQREDPFYAALVECSKDGGESDGDGNDDHSSNFGGINKGSSKINRTLSDRFGLINMYTSCKRTCAVSESIVNLSRKGSHNYLLNRRSS
ncbi:hypothetical protein OROMI_005202 [Orobanche minor]